MISLRQLAKLCGVSATTVSRGLRDDPRVHSETRAQIKALASAHSYRPNRLVEAVFTGRARMMAVVVSDLTIDPVSHRVAITADLLRARGYATLVFNTHDNPAVEEECLQMAVAMRVAGVIVSPVDYTANEMHYLALRRDKIPFVIASEFSPGVAVPHLYGDDEKVAAEAVLHLAHLGHRRIAHLAGPAPTLGRGGRYAGYCRGLAQSGLNVDSTLVRVTDWSMQSGAGAMRELLKLRPRPTAVFAATDQIAIGAIEEIRASGLQVPRDISIIGMGDSAQGRMLTPPLTTIENDRSVMARESVNLLFRMIAAKPGESLPRRLLNVTVPGRLIVRGSTTRARKSH